VQRIFALSKDTASREQYKINSFIFIAKAQSSLDDSQSMQAESNTK
jgi:hypothetical protein